MKRRKRLSTRRDRDYDYSQAGTHLIAFKTKGKEEILGSTKHGMTTLSDVGCAFLDVLGQTLQNFPCVRVHAMNITPSEVELVLEITERRNSQVEPPKGSEEWKYYRRLMTLPVFMGYLKMNSSHRINKLLGKEGGDVWARRYASCVLTDAEDLASVCAELHEEWASVVLTPQSRKKEKRSRSFGEVLASEFGGSGGNAVRQSGRHKASGQLGEAMFLGRVLLLTGARRELGVDTPAKRVAFRGGGAGGVAGRCASVIRNVGPDRIFVSE